METKDHTYLNKSAVKVTGLSKYVQPLVTISYSRIKILLRYTLILPYIMLKNGQTYFNNRAFDHRKLFKVCLTIF